MALNERTHKLLSKVMNYLSGKMMEIITDWNEENPDEKLPFIAETDIGFRDVVSGLRSYPAMCIAQTGRNTSEPYMTDYDLNVCIAVRGSDIDELQRMGYDLMDCLEDAMRADHTLGGCAVDSAIQAPSCGVVSEVFIAAFELEVRVNLGPFGGMQ